MRPDYADVIDELYLFTVLAAFEPTLIGTPPLQIDTDSSDIDIACTAKCLEKFVSTVTSVYSSHDNFFSDYFNIREQPSTRCVFTFKGWPIELFCQSLPVAEQWGVRHFKIEKKILQLDSELATPFIRKKVTQLKRSGLKTEAAFATILGLVGDPFEAVMKLEKHSRAELMQLIMNSTQAVDR